MRSSKFLSSLLLTLLCAFSAHSQTPVAEIREQLGGPTLFIDGRPHSGFSTMTYRPQLSDYEELADIGIDLFCFSTSSDHPFYPFAADAWIGPEEYDYSQLDERARQVLEASPEAWLLPRVNVAAPGWWLDLHPDEVCVYSDGSNLELSRDYVQDQRAPSMASGLWRDSVKENLGRMIDHIEAQDYGKRVIGYHIASGITEEWMYWGFQSNQLADYSKPGITAFRDWLREKYRTDTVLQDVWGEPSATFATAEVPNATWRNRMDHGIFLNPIQSMRVVDYNLFLSDMVADCISEFARAVKEKTNGTKVVGAFYGYLLEIAWHHHAIPPSGHLAIDKLLRDPSLDFFSSPSSYGARPPGTGFSIFMSLTESFRRHGKLWMDENDYRGFLAKDAKPQHGYVETLDETLSLHWRELGNVLTHGAGMWWFNMWGGWYSDPRLLEQMETMVELGKENLGLDRDSIAEVAVVVDPLSPAYLGAMETLHSIGLLQYKETWAKFGAPFDLLTLQDYCEGLGNRYKMVVFPNLTFAGPEPQNSLRRRLDNEGSLPVWHYAPGYWSPDGLSKKRIEEVTGFAVTEKRNLEKKRPRVVDSFGGVFQPQLEIDPLFIPSATGEVLAKFEESGDPSVVLGQGQVYSSLPAMSVELFRELAQRAGVHLYTDLPLAMHANRHWISVHAPEKGEYAIHLREPAEVRAYPSLDFSRVDDETVRVSLDRGETVLFRLDPEREK